MEEKSNEDDPSANNTLISNSFTTLEFIDKVKETLLLANEIQQHGQVKQNDKIQNLLKLQSHTALQLLSNMNKCDRNLQRATNFAGTNMSDVQRFSMLTEINDSIVDKIIDYTQRVKNIKEGKQDLIAVHAKLNQNQSTIELRDFNRRSMPGKFTLMKRSQPDSGPRMESSTKRITFLAGHNVRRPQTIYRMKVDNSYSTPFIPLLTRKPNSMKPLEESMVPIPYENVSTNVTDTKSEFGTKIVGLTHVYPHPYQTEIESFEVPLDFLEIDSNHVNDPVPTCTNLQLPQLIQTRDQLNQLVEILKQEKEIAVDLEHHSFRTYQGFTCLMQLSTDSQDYVIDVFPLWNEMEILNEIFTSPKILKVFHGSDYDILWLQRDLGLYVCNLFDTGVAAKMLNYSHVSLSFLVQKFVDIQLDKRFQLADWRIRPIPDEMLEYARFDTRFLLYIYRKLKMELLERGDQSANLLRMVMDKSRELCLKRYEKRQLDPNDHLTLIWKNNLRFNSQQKWALKQLYAWRDTVARNEDESCGYVLPNNLLTKICEILPREQQGILACCNPIPPLVRQNINMIHKIILDARTKSIDNDCNEITSTITVRTLNSDRSIDLSNDHLIDTIDHHEEMVPLLSWSSERKCLELNNQTKMEVDNVEIEHQTIKKMKGIKVSQMMNMFISNVSDHVQKETEERQRKSNVDQLFMEYVSPFQLYKNAIEQKEKGQNNRMVEEMKPTMKVVEND